MVVEGKLDAAQFQLSSLAATAGDVTGEMRMGSGVVTGDLTVGGTVNFGSLNVESGNVTADLEATPRPTRTLALTLTLTLHPCVSTLCTVCAS